MDAAVDDHKAIGIVRVEEVQRGTLIRPHAVVVYVAVFHAHIAALAHTHRAVAAFIDVGISHRKITAVARLNAEDAAAVETAAVHRAALAAVKVQHPACAEAGLGRVSGGERFDMYAPAPGEAEHVCVARDGGKCGFAHARAPNGEVFHVMQHQFKPVIDLVPAIVRAVGVLAVIRRGREVEAAGGELDHCVRRDGGKQLVHGGDARLILCSSRGRPGGHAAAQQQRHGQHGGKYARAAFFIVHDLLQSFFQIFLLSREGGGCHARGQRPVGSHIQKRVAVGELFRPIHAAQQQLITAQLTGAVQLPADQPGEGVEPLGAEYRHGKPLVQRIAPTPVHQLMPQDVSQQLFVIDALRQGDDGMKDAEHQGRRVGGAAIKLRLSPRQGAVNPPVFLCRAAETPAHPGDEEHVACEIPRKTERCAHSPDSGPKRGRFEVDIIL